MTSAMTPELAHDYLATLWVDLRGVAVLDGTGTRVAGDPALATRAAALLAGAPAGQAVRVTDGDDVIYAVRSDANAIAASVGPEALEAVVICDLLAVLADLGG